MTNYVLDTNIVSAIARRDQTIVSRMAATVKPDDHVFGCPMVWYEVRRGLLAKAAAMQMEYFEEVFANFVWQDYTRADWEQAARLWVHRRAKGLPIGDADLLIGVFALNRDAILVTNNEKDFVELGVTTENWTKA